MSRVDFKGKGRGFTLVEVLVALGVAAFALVLLLSASQTSLRRSLRAREVQKVSQIAESKLIEWRLGLETGNSGDFKELPGWTWQIRVSAGDVRNLKGLERVRIEVFSPDSGGKPSQSLVSLRYDEKRLAPPAP